MGLPDYHNDQAGHEYSLELWKYKGDRGVGSDAETSTGSGDALRCTHAACRPLTLSRHLTRRAFLAYSVNSYHPSYRYPKARPLPICIMAYGRRTVHTCIQASELWKRVSTCLAVRPSAFPEETLNDVCLVACTMYSVSVSMFLCILYHTCEVHSLPHRIHPPCGEHRR